MLLSIPNCASNHGIDGASNLGREIGLDLIHLSELCEVPTTILAQVVYTRYPVGLHRRLLFLCILSSVTLNLDHEMQQMIVTMSVIHQHNEIRPVDAHL